MFWGSGKMLLVSTHPSEPTLLLSSGAAAAKAAAAAKQAGLYWLVQWYMSVLGCVSLYLQNCKYLS